MPEDRRRVPRVVIGMYLLDVEQQIAALKQELDDDDGELLVEEREELLAKLRKLQAEHQALWDAELI